MKNIKGVTLISLIVTIIVLLIITGVSVSITINEEGLIEQAQTAVIKTEQHNALEEVSDAWAKVASEYYSKWTNELKSEYFSEDKLADKLNPYLTGKGKVSAISSITEYTITYKKDNQEEKVIVFITITEKGSKAKIETHQQNNWEALSNALSEVANQYNTKEPNESKSEYFSVDKLAAKLNPYLAEEGEISTISNSGTEYTITYKKDNQDYTIIVDKNGNARILANDEVKTPDI